MFFTMLMKDGLDSHMPAKLALQLSTKISMVYWRSKNSDVIKLVNVFRLCK